MASFSTLLGILLFTCFQCGITQPQYTLTLSDGFSDLEGYLLIKTAYTEGTICADDDFDENAGKVACRELGKGELEFINKDQFYGGRYINKMISNLKCNGNEASLGECLYKRSYGDCPLNNVAGVSCTGGSASPTQPPDITDATTTDTTDDTTAAPVPAPPPPAPAPPPPAPAPNGLPDLRVDNTVLQDSVFVEAQTMNDLECAMEEKCVSSSAYVLKQNNPATWTTMIRLLLRFSSSVFNNGDVAFRPPQGQWIWHECHGHFHSMGVFANYDIVNDAGEKKAEGHKASFCLEDSECEPGYQKKYACGGLGNAQGISPGCKDNYLAELDCQWIDITDLESGNYKFRVTVNPERTVQESDYANNMVTCNLEYEKPEATVKNCHFGE